MREEVNESGLAKVSSMEIGTSSSHASIADDFKNSMRNLAASVSVVTVGTGIHASGFTATSVISLSVDPPTVLVSINRGSASWPLVQSGRKFAVNVLSSAHFDIAETFAGRSGLKGHERYIDPRWERSSGQVPHLVDALAVIECDLEEVLPRYSHAILIGRVVKVITNSSGRPLVYWQGSYNQLCDRSRQD